jgi:hypothetical protein
MSDRQLKKNGLPPVPAPAPKVAPATAAQEGAPLLQQGAAHSFSNMPLSGPPFVPAMQKEALGSSVPQVLTSPGASLDPGIKTEMGQRFRFNFDQVKVHQDAGAAASAEQLQARAYTTEGHMVFGAGKYQPQLPEGRRLIAHELAHVVQQSQYPHLPEGTISQPGDPAEKEAARIADTVTSGHSLEMPPRLSAPSAQVMRDTGDDTATAAPPAAATTPAIPTFGTAKTTSPVATLSPRKEIQQQLTNEATLMNNVQLIMDWVKTKTPASNATGDAADIVPGILSFGTEELFRNKPLMKKLKPVPKTEEELKATLEMMAFYGLISRPIYTSLSATEPEYLIHTDAKTQQPDTARFDKARKGVTDLKTRVETLNKRPDSLSPLVETSVLPLEMAAGTQKEEVKPEKDAAAALAKLEQEMETLEKSGSDDEATQKKKADLQKQIVAAKEKLRKKQGFHTFAADVTNLLERLGKINTTWRAGTYPNHSWGEFSADVFLQAGLVNVPDADEFSGKYWKRDVVRQFFDDLNSETEKEDPVTGRFAWRAIYNDKPLGVEINKKYGAGRIVHVPHHGPDGDKLHIHLDLKPVKQKLDSKSGYEIKDGRIILP